MTVRTRRRLMMCLLLGLITLPAEAVVLPVLRTPDPAMAARDWASDLGTNDLQTAALDIHAYPYVYRRAIMGALTPDERAQAWQAHFQSYLSRHPELTVTQQAVLERAAALATSDLFTGNVAPADVQDQLTSTYAAAIQLLGLTTARDLFYRMGSGDTADAPAGGLSLVARLTNSVREYFIVHAARSNACTCSDDADCWEPWQNIICTETVDCDAVTNFPMCGPLWCYACTGTCKSISSH
jgi:hypothetical protein